MVEAEQALEEELPVEAERSFEKGLQVEKSPPPAMMPLVGHSLGTFLWGSVGSIRARGHTDSWIPVVLNEVR